MKSNGLHSKSNLFNYKSVCECRKTYALGCRLCQYLDECQELEEEIWERKLLYEKEFKDFYNE